MKTTYDVIKEARAKIATKEQWCQKAFAVDRNGNEQSVDSPAACAFCAWGAVMSVKCSINQYHDAMVAIGFQASRLYPKISSIPQLNDDLGYEAVINVFDTYLKENAP